MEDCLFCKIAAGEIPSERILENEDFIVIKDIHPKVAGHSLVISKKHYETLADLPLELYEKFLKTADEAIAKLLKETDAEGYNLVMNNKKVAGQIIPHLHLHILPRKESDGFRLNV